jgi:integrase
MSELLLDRAGRRRSPATLPGFHTGHAPGTRGLHYPADPPKVEEIVAVMRTAGDGAHGRRLRGLIVIMWRAGLRIQEALALTEGDLDHRRGSLLVRSEQLQPWLETRRELRSVHCCASSTAPRAVGTGRPRRPAPSCGAAPPRPVCGDGLRRTSSGTPMPSRWLAKACR